MADQQTQNSTLLDLSTVERPEHIRIDGQDYPLACWGDFSVVEYHRIQRAGARLSELMQAERDLNEEEEQDLQARADYLFSAIAPGVPADVAAKVKPGQRLQVALAFFEKAVPGTSESEKQPPAPGKSTSRRSSASTGGGRKTG